MFRQPIGFQFGESTSGQRRRSRRCSESRARRTRQRKKTKKTPNSPNAITHQPKAATSRLDIDPDAAYRNLHDASLQKMPTHTRKIKAIPMHCTRVSFCLPLLRFRHNLPSFWTVSGNTTFRCRARRSCSHSSLPWRMHHLLRRHHSTHRMAFAVLNSYAQALTPNTPTAGRFESSR